MNTVAIILVSMIVVIMFVLIFIRNQKDRKELENKITHDFRQRKAGDEDIGAEEKM